MFVEWFKKLESDVTGQSTVKKATEVGFTPKSILELKL
jgi:hypothetical protein